MRKPDTLDGEQTCGQWWKHLKEYKRAVHKAERRNWKNCIAQDRGDASRDDYGLRAGLVRWSE